jgi:hypothetical protein
VAAIKAAIAAAQELIAAIAAGGWAAVAAVLVLCMVGLLIASPFGLFFAGAEGTGSGIPQAVAQLNGEFTARIEQIKESTPHDVLDLDNDTESFPFPSTPSTATAPEPAQQPEAKGRKRTRNNGISKGEMDAYREIIRENIRYDDFVREHPYDMGQLDEMVELMVEAVCSKKKNLRVAGNDFPQAVVKSRLLKLEGEHIRFVFDCLKENTTQVRNMKQYLLTVLYNAPVTIESHYAAQVNHDLFQSGVS